MKPAAFDYHAPRSVDEAVALLAELDDAKVIAGGQSLVPLLNLRLVGIGHLVDLGRVQGLDGVERRGSELWIGASTTQATAEASPEIADAVPLLARGLPLVGHFQIRNRGTIGGSLAHADPAAEIPSVARTVDATIEAMSPRGRRSIPAADFFTGYWTTSLADDEIVTGASFPVWSGRSGFAVEEVARRHGDFAIAGACVAVEVDNDDTMRRCAIGLLGLGTTPERAGAVESALTGTAAADVDATAAGHDAVAGLESIPSDLNGSAEYRRRVGATVVDRALTRALEEALHA